MKEAKYRNNKILTASLWNFVGTFLLKAVTFVSVPIFTRMLSPANYGIVSTYTTYISFLGIVIGFSLNTATANARIDFSDRFNEYNANIIRVSFLIFIVELILGNSVCFLIENTLSINRFYLNLIFFIAYSEYVVNTYYKINSVDFRFKSNMKISILNALISVVLSICLIDLMENDVTAKLIGQGFFLFCVAIVLFIYIGFRKTSKFVISDVDYAKKIALPNICHQISLLIMSQSDRVIIFNMCNAATAAKYSVVYNFGLIMQMIWNAINEVWVPWLYRELYRRNDSHIVKMSKIYLFLFTFLSGIVVLIAPDFMIILAPESYLEAKNIIAPVILSIYFMFLYSFFVNIEIYNKKNKYMAISTFIAAVGNIVGNYVLIPVFGYKAAAYTTLFSYVLLMILHYIFLTYLFKLNIYTIKMFICPIVFMIIMTTISLLTLEIIVVRYLVMLALFLAGGIWMIVKKAYINDFIYSIKR